MLIAIDAMGGDHAPARPVEGGVAAARHLRVAVALVGRRDLIDRELGRCGVDDPERLNIRVVHAPDVVDMSESPAAALRRKPRSSIRVAMELAANGEAAGVVSAGHTGATVLTAHAVFGMAPGVDRPALAATIPTSTRAAVLLDSGASVECRPQHLVQFASMGVAYARIALATPRPRVALLSIGEEETKGNDLTREAHRLLKESGLNFKGNVEARDLYSGEADVIVCDGFTGNVALKVSEGLVETIESLLRDELSRTFSTRVGYLLSRRAFRRFRKRVDYSEYGGAPLLGVGGVAVVAHGRSSSKAIRNAVVVTHRLVEQGLVSRLREEIAAASAAHS